MIVALLIYLLFIFLSWMMKDQFMEEKQYQQLLQLLRVFLFMWERFYYYYEKDETCQRFCSHQFYSSLMNCYLIELSAYYSKVSNRYDYYVIKDSGFDCDVNSEGYGYNYSIKYKKIFRQAFYSFCRSYIYFIVIQIALCSGAYYCCNICCFSYGKTSQK